MAAWGEQCEKERVGVGVGLEELCALSLGLLQVRKALSCFTELFTDAMKQEFFTRLPQDC